MRIRTITPLMFLFVLFVGCSSGGNNPATPSPDEMMPAPQAGEVQILGFGTMNLEDGTVESNSRTSDAYIDITGFVGSQFSYTIDGLIPPDILDITLTINNNTPWTVNDVCIVFDELYGKTVVNPDSYTDIFKPWDINPFIAFGKQHPLRNFYPGINREQLLLQFPSGANPMVDYFIIAHLGGNTGGVYELSDWSVEGYLSPEGGDALIKVRVRDHQDNVTAAYADTTALTGSITELSQSADPEIWEADITNSENAPVGTYAILVMAYSPSSPYYQTYNYFEILVVEDIPGINSIVFVPKPANDTWVDICVKRNGPVYIAADHPDTGNTGSKRTAIRFDNDLTNMTVINEGTGINEGRAYAFDKLDVSEAGYILNNPDRNRQALWSDSGGDTLSLVHNYHMPGEGIAFEDIWDVSSATDNHLVIYWPSQMGSDPPFDVNSSYVWYDSDPTDPNIGGMVFEPTYYDFFDVVGIDGPGDAIFFISTATKGYLSKSGDWSVGHSVLEEYATMGTLGTGNSEFTGGLDVACDSNNNIVTLENHGSGIYRFQKFDYDLNWIYSSFWADDGDPMRMDFDKADDFLYLISSTGVHIMLVE